MKEKNLKDFLEPGYDPHQLRVVDLKQLLDHYKVVYPSKARKATLVKLFKDELIPKLKQEETNLDQSKMKGKASEKNKSKISSRRTGKVKSEKIHSQKSRVEKSVRKSPSKESRKTLRHLLEQQQSPSVVTASDDQTLNNPFMKSTVPKKRSFNRLNDNEDKEKGTMGESDSNRSIYKSTRRKEQFSSSPISSPLRPGNATKTLFPRNVAIKFEDEKNQEHDEKEDAVELTKRRKTSSRSRRKPHKKDVVSKNLLAESNPEKVVIETKLTPRKPLSKSVQFKKSSQNKERDLSSLEKYENESGSSVVHRDQLELSPRSSESSSMNYITAINEPKEDYNEDSGWNVKQIAAISASTPVSSPKKKNYRKVKSHMKKNSELTLKLINEMNEDVITGPTKPIKFSQEHIHKEKEHNTDDKIPAHYDSSSDESIRKKIHTPEMQSSVEDETVLKQLQDEFDKETSRVEEESMIAMKSVDSSLKPFISRLAIFRFFFIWLTVLGSFFFFSIYRQQRIKTGFCGYEVYTPLLTVDKLKHPLLAEYTDALNEAFRVNCIPCPAHAVCDKYSHLECKQDYTIYKPWYSGFGLIPTLNKCVLDSEKVAKINKIVKTSCDVLAKRNADFNCGTGDDKQVGLDFSSLQDYIIERLDMERALDDGEFNYLWDKSLTLMKDKQELVFHDAFVRSYSHSKFSIKCKLKHFFLDMLIRLKYWILALSAVIIVVGATYIKLETYLAEKRMVKELTGKVIEKLQQQSTLFRHHEVEHRYIGKIQLRDYYLTDPSIKQKKCTEIWERVAKVIERNSNISAYQLEVNGEIMRVWEWASDI